MRVLDRQLNIHMLFDIFTYLTLNAAGDTEMGRSKKVPVQICLEPKQAYHFINAHAVAGAGHG